MFGLMGRKQEGWPVSYTHLDVYKRQRLQRYAQDQQRRAAAGQSSDGRRGGRTASVPGVGVDNAEFNRQWLDLYL